MPDDSIYKASAEGDSGDVTRLLDQNPDLVNQDDSHGWRPVFHAALNRQYEVVKLLLGRGADLAAHDGYVMHYAGEVSGNKRVVELLLQYGALESYVEPRNANARQFIAAVFLADERRVAALLSLYPALAHERYARGDTALHHACRNGDLGLVRILVGSGADVNAMSNTSQFPLYCAAGHGHVETVAWLLAQGADTALTLEDGKTLGEWLRQFAAVNSRLRECYELVAQQARNAGHSSY